MSVPTPNHASGDEPLRGRLLYERLHQLVLRTLEDADAPEHAELARLLAAEPEAQDVYVAYMQDTSGLGAYAKCELPDGDATIVPPGDRSCMTPKVNGSHRDAWGGRRVPSAGRLGWLAIAASLAAAVTIGWWGSGRTTDRGDGEIATVIRLTDVEWSGQVPPRVTPLSRVSTGQSLAFDEGQLEIVFDSGVELLVTGPAEMRIESPLRVAANRGAYSARVGENGKGFTLDTPATSVKDLGTEFAVAIHDDGATGVAVFDGSVDVTPTSSRGTPAAPGPIRLTQGEALEFSRGGATERIVAMRAGEYPTAAGRPGSVNPAAGAIEDVSDNLGGSGSKKFYRIVPGGFGEDARAFVDRDHEWNGVDASGLPPFLVGGDYVMPFNDDKYLVDLEVSVRLRSACNLYVLFDNNMTVPDWLRDGFTDTGFDVGLDHGSGPFTGGVRPQVGPGRGIENRFSVWRRLVEGPGEIALGHAEKPADKLLGWNMFGVVTTALPPDRATPPDARGGR